MAENYFQQAVGRDVFGRVVEHAFGFFFQGVGQLRWVELVGTILDGGENGFVEAFLEVLIGE